MLRSSRIFLLFGALCSAASVHATNGYWSTGYGTKSKMMAGACVAMELGPMCAASNPATLVQTGNSIAFGGSLFAPKRGFWASSAPPGPMPAGEHESENDLFLIPYFGLNYKIDEKSSFGVALGGNGGLNTEYNTAIFSAFGPATAPAGVDMKQVFLGLTYSRKLNEQHSYGVTPILAVQTLEVTGLEPFAGVSINPTKVTNNGTDVSYGGGLRVGWLWKPTADLNIGAAYQSRLYMSRFKDYAGLLAEQGDFDVPSNWDLGFAYKVNPEWTFSFDWQRINYSEVAAIGNPSDGPLIPGALGGDNGMGFGWEDIDVYKFGLQWELDPAWTARAGYSYSDEAVPPSQAFLNILAPAVVRQHFSFGVSHKLDQDSGVSLAVTYVPEEKVHGTNINTGPQTGYIYMSQWELELGYSMSF